MKQLRVVVDVPVVSSRPLELRRGVGVRRAARQVNVITLLQRPLRLLTDRNRRGSLYNVLELWSSLHASQSQSMTILRVSIR